MPETKLNPRQRRVLNIIHAHKKSREPIHKEWDRYLHLYNNDANRRGTGMTSQGQPTYDDTHIEVHTNYPYAFVDTVVAMVVPPKPQVEVIPREPEKVDSALAQEQLINWTFQKEKFRPVLDKVVAKTVMYGIGFVKTVWNMARSEVRMYEKDPRRVWLDNEAARWDEMRYIIEVTTLSSEQFKKRIKDGLYDKEIGKGVSASSYPDWLDYTLRDTESEEDKASRDAFKWVIVYEFHDLETRMTYHVADNATGILFEGPCPYQHNRNPFTPLVFNDNLKDLSGLSDIKLIFKLQKLIDEIDTLELQHAASSIPLILIDKKLLEIESETISALERANFPGQYIAISLATGRRMADLFAETPMPTLSPSFDKMRDRIIMAIEFILGLPQYARGAIGKTEVATEAALADTVLRTRTGRRISAINELLASVAMAAVGLYAEFLAPDYKLTVKLDRATDAIEISKKILGLEDFDPAKFFWEYEAIEYAPLENNRQYKSQQIQMFMKELRGSPNVDQEKLTKELLEVLRLPHLYMATPPQAPAEPDPQGQPPLPPPQPGLPGGAGGPLPTPGPAEVLDPSGLPNPATGALPPGLAVENPVGLTGRPTFASKVQ